MCDVSAGLTIEHTHTLTHTRARAQALYRGLKALLDMDGDVESLYQTFSVDVEVFDTHQTVELKEGGAELPVTNENRQGAGKT